MVRIRIKGRKEKKFKNKWIMVLFIVIITFYLVAAYYQQYYNIGNNSYQWVDEYGTCYKVQVGTSPNPGAGVFVPTNIAEEWSAFIDNYSSGYVSLITSDADSDGYPTTSCPTIGTDCYDSNANAHPGQTAWYTNNRGDGSFDYDCSGVAEKEWTETCDLNNFGWNLVTPPACGVSGTYCLDVDGCIHGCSTYVQACH